MDEFKSAIFHREILEEAEGAFGTGVYDLEHDLVGNDTGEYDLTEEYDLHIDTEAWGWWNGGLVKLLKLQHDRPVAPREALFFRGAALFGNFDDAKNDYLMNPEIEVHSEAWSTPAETATEDQHIPFGMVIPKWRTPGGMAWLAGEDDPVLVSVTIILYWQEL